MVELTLLACALGLAGTGCNSGFCDSLSPEHSAALIEHVKKVCKGRCCADRTLEFIKYAESRGWCKGRRCAFHAYNIKADGDYENCTGVGIDFGRTWPCHDEDWDWSSKRPKTIRHRSALDSGEVEAFQRLGFTIEEFK